MLSDWHDGHIILLPTPLNSLPQSRHLQRLVFNFLIFISAMGPPTVHILTHPNLYIMFLLLIVFFIFKVGKPPLERRVKIICWCETLVSIRPVMVKVVPPHLNPPTLIFSIIKGGWSLIPVPTFEITSFEVLTALDGSNFSFIGHLSFGLTFQVQFS